MEKCRIFKVIPFLGDAALFINQIWKILIFVFQTFKVELSVSFDRQTMKPEMEHEIEANISDLYTFIDPKISV